MSGAPPPLLPLLPLARTPLLSAFTARTSCCSGGVLLALWPMLLPTPVCVCVIAEPLSSLPCRAEPFDIADVDSVAVASRVLRLVRAPEADTRGVDAVSPSNTPPRRW